MDISLYKASQILGVPPSVWTVRNPLKIYEFFEVTRPSGLRRNHSILDFGCGKGHWTLALAKHCANAIGIDTSDTRIAVARSFLQHSGLKTKVQFLCARLEDANIPSASLDRVFSFSVLEPIINREEALSEIVRILKPKGELHISVDSLANLKDIDLLIKHKHDHSVVQYFTENSLRQQLHEAGLDVIEIHAIMHSQYARQEFMRRIKPNYKYDLVRRILVYLRLRDEDRRSENCEGMMLIGRARRPST